jgi:hypothetical protein
MSGSSVRAVAVSVTMLFVGACGSGDPFTSVDAGGSTDGGGTVDASLDTGTMSDTGCDATQSPKSDPCVVSDSVGVFVAPNGSDTAQGTMSAPFATVGRGVLAASSSGKRVYICTATYAEQVVLDASANGVSLYGGLACPGDDAGASWSYSGRPATIAPTSGYALKIDTVSMPIVVEDLELATADAATPGESSIAAFVNGSASVDFVRVTLSAGSGADASPTADLTGQPLTTANGNPGTTSITGSGTGGMAVTCSCANGGSSTGGAGGNGAPMTQSAGSPGSAIPILVGTSPTNGAAGGAGCTAGHAGGAAPGGNGGDGAIVLGTLTSNGWTPASGTGGSSGSPGQGGGGAGGDTVAGPGTSGACGGCGGANGGPGAGGGASIALAIVMSTVTLDACTLVAGNGGKGGKGGKGQAGGLGGVADNSQSCLSGGNGGIGGAGGGGGGGAGGSSWGVAFVGTPPVQMNGTMITIGALGSGGPGGAGAGMNGNDGMNGEATEVKSF